MVNAAQQAKIRANQNAEFIASHQGWDIYISPYNRGVIAIGRSTQEAVLGIVTASKCYKLSNIASVEVLRDGATVTTTNRGSQVAGALIGGVAFGAVGLLIGGVTGSKRNTNTIHSVAIKLIVDAGLNAAQFVLGEVGVGGTALRQLLLSHGLFC